MYDKVDGAAKRHALIVMGALHPRRHYGADHPSGTLILLGAGPAFWPALTKATEFTDGMPDPIDRYSDRVLADMAQEFPGAVTHFPFGGPPYAPFIDWALKSGRAFSSPTGMLVHDSVGLMISYRGALAFADEFPIPESTAQSPCDTCPDQPCVSTCPAGALSASAPYDVPTCHSFLNTARGADCMTNGCAVRRACPISEGAARTSAQSAHHMLSFHPL